MTLDRAAMARLVDHTLLKPEATPADVARIIAEGRELGTYSVCLSPSFLPLSEDLGECKLAVVCGFPSGKHAPEVKAAEAKRAVENGADEIDMVIDVGLLKSGDAAYTQREIEAVRAAAPKPAVLKVIIESGALTDDEIVAACQAAEAAGADFVKTSTGFHPSGGATVHAVELMRRTVGDRLGVKASGGIRDAEAAQAMVEAGASRLGLSSSKAVLDGCAE